MKIQHLFLSAVLALSLTACTTSDPKAADETKNAANSSQSDSKGAKDEGKDANTPSMFTEKYVTIKGKFGEEPKFTLVKDGEIPDKLVIHDMSVGDGDKVSEGAEVRFNYAGYSLKNGKVFDSSFAKKEPLSISIDKLVAGMSKGLLGMQVGGRRVLVITPELGYGDQSPTPDIAANDTLVFVVDLLGTNPK